MLFPVADGHVARAQRGDLGKVWADHAPLGQRPEVGGRRDARRDHRAELGATEGVGDRSQDVRASGQKAAERDVGAGAASLEGVELGVAGLVTDARPDERHSGRNAGSGQAARIVDQGPSRRDRCEGALHRLRVRRQLEQRLVEPPREHAGGPIAERAQRRELVLLREPRRPP